MEEADINIGHATGKHPSGLDPRVLEALAQMPKAFEATIHNILDLVFSRLAEDRKLFFEELDRRLPRNN